MWAGAAFWTLTSWAVLPEPTPGQSTQLACNYCRIIREGGTVVSLSVVMVTHSSDIRRGSSIRRGLRVEEPPAPASAAAEAASAAAAAGCFCCGCGGGCCGGGWFCCG